MRSYFLFLSLCCLCNGARLTSSISLPAGATVSAFQVDAAGNIYLAGSSKPATPRGTQDTSDGFVGKLSSSGKVLFWTVFGGSQPDEVNGMVVAADGSILATGDTAS